MDNNSTTRRQPGQPPPGAAPRLRTLFHAPRRPTHHINASTTSVHIAAEESDPKDDMVERDSSGEYKVVIPNFTWLSAAGLLSGGDADEEDDDRRMILCYLGNGSATDSMPPAMLATIKQHLTSSMSRAAKSLENDRWMFESDKTRQH